MSSPRFEQALTELYVSENVREEFLKDPEPFIKSMNLAEEEAEALRKIDRIGLVFAAESFAKKRRRFRRADIDSAQYSGYKLLTALSRFLHLRR